MAGLGDYVQVPSNQNDPAILRNEKNTVLLPFLRFASVLGQ